MTGTLTRSAWRGRRLVVPAWLVLRRTVVPLRLAIVLRHFGTCEDQKSEPVLGILNAVATKSRETGGGLADRVVELLQRLCTVSLVP